MKDFDFDELKTLAEQDPDAFEERRKELIEEGICAFTDDEEARQRMRRFQFRLDRESRHIKDPFVRANHFYYLMVDSAKEMATELDRVAGELTELRGLLTENREKSAEIAVFEA